MKKVIFCVAMSAVLTVSLCACSQNPSPTESSAPHVTPGAEPPAASMAPTPAPAVEAAELAIGETAEVGDWTVSVTAFEFSTEIDNGYGYFSPDEGNQYGVVSMTVTNNGTETGTFWPSFSLGDDIIGGITYDGTYEYSSVQLLAYDEDMHNKSMNPLTTATGKIVFELPDAVASDTAPLVITISQGSNSATFNLR